MNKINFKQSAFDILKHLTHPIPLSAILFMTNIQLYVAQYLTTWGKLLLIIMVIIANVAITAILLKEFIKRKNTLIPNLIAYSIWLLGYWLDFSALQKTIFSITYIASLISMIISGLFIVVIFTYARSDLNLMSLGAFFSAMFIYSLNREVAFYLMILSLLIAAIYAGLLYELDYMELKHILISFTAGAIIFAAVYALTVFVIYKLFILPQ